VVERAGDNMDTGSDLVVELTAVAGSVNPIFLHQHRRLPTPMFQRAPMSPTCTSAEP